MEIYSLTNSNLQPLKGKKEQEKENIKDNQAVVSLISSKLLLNKSLNVLLTKLLVTTKKINNFLEYSESELEDDERIIGGFRRYHHIRNRYVYSLLMRNRDSRRNEEWKILRKLKIAKEGQREELEQEWKQLRNKENKEINGKINGQLKSLSKKVQRELDIFEKERKKTLNILDSLTVYTCKDCNKIVCSERFHSGKCSCGKDIKLPSDCRSFTIHRLGKEMITFFENNMWLEHGIDCLLRKKDFQTLCGIHILGHSGVLHEIDNIGELKSENLRIFCECKNKAITVSDVLVFCGKMSDIGCGRGYMFTTAESTKKEAKYLARSKNIKIIEEVLEKKESELLKEIE